MGSIPMSVMSRCIQARLKLAECYLAQKSLFLVPMMGDVRGPCTMLVINDTVGADWWQAVIFVSLSSTLKSKELSPVIGHKAVQALGATVPPFSGQQSNSQSPHSAEHSPHTLHKGSSHWDSSLIQSTDKILFKFGIIGWSDHCMHLMITRFSFCHDFVMILWRYTSLTTSVFVLYCTVKSCACEYRWTLLHILQWDGYFS